MKFNLLNLHWTICLFSLSSVSAFKESTLCAQEKKDFTLLQIKIIPKPVCRYNKFGYSKFSDKCCLRHNDVLCSDNNCNVFQCEKDNIKENNDKIKEMETRLHAVENR